MRIERADACSVQAAEQKTWKDFASAAHLLADRQRKHVSKRDRLKRDPSITMDGTLKSSDELA